MISIANCQVPIADFNSKCQLLENRQLAIVNWQ